MSARPPIVCAILGAATGVLFIVARPETPLPLAIAQLMMPAVPLLYGTTASTAALVATNAAIYALLGLLVGVAISFWDRGGHLARRPNGER